MNNNLEFENEDPTPDSVEDNHPRTNYGEGFTKQETLEDAAEDNAKKVGHYAGYQDFIAGAKWQAERMYSEEDMKSAIEKTVKQCNKMMQESYGLLEIDVDYIFEQFKKK